MKKEEERRKLWEESLKDPKVRQEIEDFDCFLANKGVSRAVVGSEENP